MRLVFTASGLGRGAETSTTRDLVISEAAVKISCLIRSWASGFWALLPKGWTSSLPPWCCSHSAACSMLMCSKIAIGCVSWTVGSGPVVYLSRAFRGASLSPGTLALLAAASSLLLVEEWSMIGGRAGGALFRAGGLASWGVGLGRGWAGRSGMVGAFMGAGAICMSVGDIMAGGGFTGVAGVLVVGGACEGVAGGVAEPSCMKSGIGKGGGVSPGSEDWYVTIGVEG